MSISSVICRFHGSQLSWSKIASGLALILLLVTAKSGFSQVLTFSTPERSTTEIGGESGETGVGAANFNGQLWTAYTGTTLNSNGNGEIYLAYNSDGGVNYPSVVLAETNTTPAEPLYSNANPALAVFNGLLYMAYNEPNGAGYTFPTFSSSSDGVHWNTPITSCHDSSSAAGADASPSLTVFNGSLWMAYRDHSTYSMRLCRIAADNTTTLASYSDITLNFNPSLAVFNGDLYVAIESNNSSHTIYLYTSPDGATFTLNTGASSDQTSTAPSLAVHNGVLYLGFRENDDSHEFLYRYSTDGQTFVSAIDPHWTEAGPPTLLEASSLPGSSYNGQLYVYFSSNTSAPNYLCSSHGQ
jgi:hypothetical protein